jgi:hypothetical protein
MADKRNAPNYPDILGYITGGNHLTVNNVVQVALAVRPPIVYAGRPFALLLLLQNLSDANVEISASLQLPARDSERQKDRFLCKDTRLEFTLGAAAVGYHVFPIATLPDTAPARDYKISIELRAEPLGNPRRIRQLDDRGGVNLDYYFFLTEEAIQRVTALKLLSFAAAKRGSVSTGRLEANFGVVRPRTKMSPVKDVAGGWVNLWALGAHTDARALLERYRSLIPQVLPKLKLQHLYKAIAEVTKARLTRAYNIQPVEVYFVNKLLIAVLNMAINPPELPPYPEAEIYNVVSTLRKSWPMDGTPIPLPHWFRGLMDMIAMDQDVVDDPAVAFSGALYDDLLRDAITHGFKMIHLATKHQLGSANELHTYSEYLVQNLRHPRQRLMFRDIYVPLILGGVTVADDTRLATSDSPLDAIGQLTKVFRSRAERERTRDNQLIFQMCEEVTDWAALRYRFWT